MINKILRFFGIYLYQNACDLKWKKVPINDKQYQLWGIDKYDNKWLIVTTGYFGNASDILTYYKNREDLKESSWWKDLWIDDTVERFRYKEDFTWNKATWEKY